MYKGGTENHIAWKYHVDHSFEVRNALLKQSS